MSTLTEQEARKFFIRFYRGEHHFPGALKPYGPGWSMSHYSDLATFDGDALTRLVFLAHDMGLRASISPLGINSVRIAIWKRIRSGSIFERHPTLEAAMLKYCGEER